jgi:hypothetical protein
MPSDARQDERQEGDAILLVVEFSGDPCDLDRLEKPDRTTNIDAAVALAMAVDRHAYQPQPVELLGWI